MDLIKEALSMGFADAAIMDTKDLVFVPVSYTHLQLLCDIQYIFCRIAMIILY